MGMFLCWDVTFWMCYLLDFIYVGIVNVVNLYVVMFWDVLFWGVLCFGMFMCWDF